MCITVCSVICDMLVDSTSLIKFVLSSECTAACAVLRPARPMRPSRPALKLVLQLVLCLAARPHGQPLADHVPMAQSCNKLPTASCYSSSSGCLRHRCSVSLLNKRVSSSSRAQLGRVGGSRSGLGSSNKIPCHNSLSLSLFIHCNCGTEERSLHGIKEFKNVV